MQDPKRKTFEAAAARAARYLESLSDRPVMPTEEALAQLSRFEEPLPDRPAEWGSTLALLDEVGSDATVASAGGRYFGFVTGGSLPEALGAHVLAGAWDQNAALSIMSPVAAKLQQVTSRWLAEIFGLPPGAGCFFVGGATVANLCGVVAGRDAVLAEAGHDVSGLGLVGAPPLRVISGAATHSTTGKILSIAGLGRQRLETVDADGQGRLRADRLPGLDGPVLLLAQAGEVNTGAFDPLAEIADWAEERRASGRGPTWVHVDGAFGLWAAASPRHRELVAGMERLDSWATDGHKWLNVPYDCGIVMVRDPAALRHSMSAQASYLVDGDVLEPMHHTPQSSQRARCIEVWAALRSLGRAGLADLIDRCCRHATRFAEGLTEAGFDVLNDVVLNQVVFALESEHDTQRVMEQVQQSGTAWLGPTRFRGRPAMRISVSSWATTEQDVDAVLEALRRAAGGSAEV